MLTPIKNKKLLIVLLIGILTLTGCTKQFKDAEGKVIQDEKTKQTLVENILCQPESLKEVYEDAIKQKKKDYKKMYEDGDLSKNDYNKKIVIQESEALMHISGGDARKLLNAIDLVVGMMSETATDETLTITNEITTQYIQSNL